MLLRAVFRFVRLQTGYDVFASNFCGPDVRGGAMTSLVCCCCRGFYRLWFSFHVSFTCVCVCVCVIVLTTLKLFMSAYLFMSVCLSARPPAWNNSAPIGRIFMKFDI
jgi:hypothetical protein